MDRSKIQQRVGIVLVSLIVFLSGLLMYKEKDGTVNFVENKATEIAPIGSPVLQTEQINAKININKASLEDLDALPGIGEVIAQRIIDYRNKVSGFKNIEEIMDVSGIGEVKFNNIKDQISI